MEISKVVEEMTYATGQVQHLLQSLESSKSAELQKHYLLQIQEKLDLLNRQTLFLVKAE